MSECERHHHWREAGGPHEPRRVLYRRGPAFHAADCGCRGHGPGHSQVGCTCGCHAGGFRRRFVSRAERIDWLNRYLEALEAEAQGVREAIEALEAKGRPAEGEESA